MSAHLLRKFGRCGSCARLSGLIAITTLGLWRSSLDRRTDALGTVAQGIFVASALLTVAHSLAYALRVLDRRRRGRWL